MVGGETARVPRAAGRARERLRIVSAAAAGSQVGGRRRESFASVRGRATFPALPISGSPPAPVTSRAGRQVRLSTSSTGSAVAGPAPSTKGNRSWRRLPEDGGRLLGLGAPLGRDLRMQGVDEDPPVALVLDAREEAPEDTERRGHDPARVPGVDALGQHLDAEGAARESAERRGAPEPVVVPAPRIEADDEARGADTGAERLDVVGEIVAPALLARLDDHHAARVRNLLLVERPEGGERGIDRVAVVRAAAAVEPIALHLRRPGSEAVPPAGHLGLLIEMAVEEEAVVALPRNLDEDEGGAPGEPDHLERHPARGVRLAPAHHVGDRGLHVAVLRPVRVEVRGLVGDADVLDELGDDRIVPERLDVAADSVGVHASLIPVARTSGAAGAGSMPAGRSGWSAPGGASGRWRWCRSCRPRARRRPRPRAVRRERGRSRRGCARGRWCGRSPRDRPGR